MANLGIKVEHVMRKFYDVQPDEDIKGLYEVRKLAEPDSELLWYFFNSNNATYHSSGNDCVIRDINQSNSGYIERLKAAFEKAKARDKKIFWLVLVFGDGIGLRPDGYEWLASIELRVSLDDITASLSMRTYPVGLGHEGYFNPCRIRIEQDKYFNTTFISCKDIDGNFTSEYMEDYFELYDNRAYRGIMHNSIIQNDEIVKTDYTLRELGELLRNMYDNAGNGMQVASIHIFGIKFGKCILTNGYKAPEIIRAAELNDSYYTELQKGLNVYKGISSGIYGMSFMQDGANSGENGKEDRVSGGENRLYYGVPGSGKSYNINQEINGRKHERVVFHPDYTYSDFVGQIMPKLKKTEDGEEKLSYEFVPGPFTKALGDAIKNPGEMFYLVIEEINRGNAPAIFGDVFQLLDRNEDGSGKYHITNFDIARDVFGDETEVVKLPSNLSIYATMNTSDQNVFTLDTAFQRRWHMKYVKNEITEAEHHKDPIVPSEVTWGQFATAINEEIVAYNSIASSSEDKQLGAFFVKGNELGADVFPEKVLKYLWDDAFKLDREQVFGPDIKSIGDLIGKYHLAVDRHEDPLKTVMRAEVYSRMVEKIVATSEEHESETDAAEME